MLDGGQISNQPSGFTGRASRRQSRSASRGTYMKGNKPPVWRVCVCGLASTNKVKPSTHAGWSRSVTSLHKGWKGLVPIWKVRFVWVVEKSF